MSNQQSSIPGVVPGGAKSDKTFFWSIYDGALARQVPAGTDGAKSRINKNEKEVFEIYERGLTGRLAGIQLKKHDDFGWQMIVTLIPTGFEDYKHIINISKESRFYSSFVERLPNINRELPITISPYSFVPRGETKKKSGFTITQETGLDAPLKIQSAYRVNEGTQEQPKWVNKYGYPTLTKEWGKMEETEQKMFFLQVDDLLTKHLKAYIEKHPPETTAASTTSQQPVAQAAATDTPPPPPAATNAPTDDLPF